MNTTTFLHFPGPDPAGTPTVSRPAPTVQKETPTVSAPAPAVREQTPIVSAENKLVSVRTQFVKRVSGPVLQQLLDKLLECQVITDDEMEVIAGKQNKTEKARAVIDTVRKKGSEASSALIAALRELDRFLSKEIELV